MRWFILRLLTGAVLILGPKTSRERLAKTLDGSGVHTVLLPPGQALNCTADPSAILITDCASPSEVIAGVRHQFPKARVIYVADAEGPRRSALDLAGTSVDRFVHRPVSQVSLLYAMGTQANNQSRLDGLVESAIDEFVSDAMDSLGDMNELLAEVTPVPYLGDGTPGPRREEAENTIVMTPRAGGVMSAAATLAQDESSSLGDTVRKRMEQVAENLFPEKPASVGTAVGHRADIDVGRLGTQNDAPEQEQKLGGVPMRGPIVRGRSDAAAILSQVAVAGLTCMVKFTRDDVRKVVFCESGVPGFALSTLPHDRLGDLLYREGRISQDQHELCRIKAVEQSKRLGQVLTDQGLLAASELAPAIRRHVEEIIYSLFSWSRGEYEIDPGHYTRNESVVLTKHPYAIIIEGVNRKINAEEASAYLGREDFILDVRAPDRFAELLRHASLTMAERKALEGIDASSSREQICLSAGIEEAGFNKLVYALCVMGITTIRESDTVDAQQIVAIEEEQILEKFSHVKRADYFTILGIERNATDAEIKSAFERALRRFTPTQFETSLRTRYRDELVEIRGILKEAYSVLADSQLRKKYSSALR